MKEGFFLLDLWEINGLEKAWLKVKLFNLLQLNPRWQRTWTCWFKRKNWFMWSPDRERSKENQWWRHNFIFTSIWRICKPCIDAFDIIYAVECKLVYYKELNVFVAKKIVMISKTMSYTKTLSRKWNLLPTERWRRKNGNYFLLRIHLSMFFLFPLAESHFENPERIVRNTFKDLGIEKRNG